MLDRPLWREVFRRRRSYLMSPATALISAVIVAITVVCAGLFIAEREHPLGSSKARDLNLVNE